MKKLLEHVLVQLVGKDNFELSENFENETVTFSIKSAPEYIGRIIGKGGSVIKSITEVVRIKAKLDDKNVYINVSEDSLPA